MPEGAEVRMLEEALKEVEGKRIASCNVVSGRYKRAAIHGLDALPGKVVKHVTAKGKLLVFHVHGGEDPIAVLSTMGMTGWWFVLKAGEPHELDKYRRVELSFEDGTVAAFFDPRNFGTLKVVSHNEAKRKLAELGPDIMMEEHLWNTVAIPEFLARVARFGRKQTLAEGLLDQRIASGCGNYIRADAMYLARLDPTMPMSSMTEDQLRLIWKCMNKVATCSFNNKAIDGEGEFENLVYGFEKSPTGHQVDSYVDANGRTVWYSPKEQQ